VLLVCYTLMTGASSSAVRACTMALVFYGGIFAGRKPDALSALAVSAAVLCLFDAGYLRDAGFILSFAVALGICVLGGALIRRLRPALGPDPFLPVRGAERKTFLHWLTSAVSVSVAAWLVSAPLMMFYFGRLAPIGIVSNIIVVPIAFGAVLSGCCSLLFGNISLFFSDLFNHASLGLIFLLEGVIELFAKAPLGDLEGLNFGLIQLLAWYAVLALLVMVLKGAFAFRPNTSKSV